MKWELYQESEPKEKYLYRFLSKEHLEKYLNSGSIWMARSDQFGDKMECVTIKDLSKGTPPIYEIEKRKKKHLISCWHLATNESLAMWDTNISDNQKRRVLAIRFETQSLIQHVKDALSDNSLPNRISKLIFGTVRYKNLLRNSKELSSDDKVRYVALLRQSRRSTFFNFSKPIA